MSSSLDQDPAFVRRAFASIANRYVLTNHVLSLGVDWLWRRRVARLVAANSPGRVLDVATGSGDLAAAVSGACDPETLVVGADFCAPMLRHARRRGLAHLVVADGMRLPFDDGVFDAVTVAYGLRNMASWAGALAEMRRVLKPDTGLLAVLDFSLPTAAALRKPYRFYLHRVLPAIGGFLTGNREAYAYLGESIERFPAGETMLDRLREAGFRDAEWHPLWGGISSIYLGRA